MQQPCILIVDDDPQIAQLLCELLTQYQFEAHCVAHATQMRQALKHHAYDVLILDVMLPDEDGFSLCQAVRQQSNVPIIMLTARDETIDRILGLEFGADDYVVKPFEPRELIARINSLLRRSRLSGELTKTTAELTQVGKWHLDHRTRQLRADDSPMVQLSQAEYRLLLVFLDHPQCVLSREVLIHKARKDQTDVFDRSIDLLISRLRQKLADDIKSPQLIHTIRGEGYLYDNTHSMD
jgi:two-component system, OmpR family, response regulator